MRVALVHNPTAGPDSYETRDLTSLLGDAGHEVITTITGKERSRDAISKRPHVVIAAGGDGTVASVAIALHKARSKTPLYILPLGTSNNIAQSLGVPDDVPELVFALSDARTQRLDIGVVRAPWGNEPFVESAGFGFIGTMLERDGTFRESVARGARAVRWALRPSTRSSDIRKTGVARLVRSELARTRTVCAGGEELDGQFIAIEAMNIRQIGPRVVLAPGTDSSDGLFDLLLVRPEHRDALADYVENNRGAAGQTPPGIMRRVPWVEMPWPSSSGHVDDEPWPADREGEAAGETVRIEIGWPIEVMLPRSLNQLYADASWG
jgi:diacylglycerol kinase (ATP)